MYACGLPALGTTRLHPDAILGESGGESAGPLSATSVPGAQERAGLAQIWRARARLPHLAHETSTITTDRSTDRATARAFRRGYASAHRCGTGEGQPEYGHALLSLLARGDRRTPGESQPPRTSGLVATISVFIRRHADEGHRCKRSRRGCRAGVADVRRQGLHRIDPAREAGRRAAGCEHPCGNARCMRAARRSQPSTHTTKTTRRVACPAGAPWRHCKLPESGQAKPTAIQRGSVASLAPFSEGVRMALQLRLAAAAAGDSRPLVRGESTFVSYASPCKCGVGSTGFAPGFCRQDQTPSAKSRTATCFG